MDVRRRPGGGRWARRGAVCSAVAVLGLAACGGDDDVLDEPVHDAVRAYLRAAAQGSPPAHPTMCGDGPGTPAHEALRAEGPGFTFTLTGSTESADTATVNVTVTGADGSPSLYAIGLLRDGGAWLVCDADTGSVALDGVG